MEILFIGDVMLGRLVNDMLRVNPPEYPWGDTLPLIRESDARICNLECVLSDGGSPARKAFAFRSDAKNIAALRAAGIDAVSLANNHALDYGTEALADMLGILDREGIFHAGAGQTIAEAKAPAAMDFGGATVGLLAATDADEPGWDAGAARAGVWFVPIDPSNARARELLEGVSRARTEADIVIVSMHWGTNRGYEPEAGHRGFAHDLIDAGADAVFGHSAHVCRGVEIYKGKPIMYGAGNFIDDYAVDETERNDESFVFVIETDRGRIAGMRMYPTIIENCQARLPDPDRATGMAMRMAELCRKLDTKTEWIEAEGTLEVEDGALKTGKAIS